MNENLERSGYTIKQLRDNLYALGGVVPHDEIDLIMMHVLRMEDTSELIKQEDEHPTEDEVWDMMEMLGARDGMPMAYILGYKWFYGRKFKVDENCLIPRPESEVMIDVLKSLDLPKGCQIYDVGTGSGCLAITASLELPDAIVYASDKYKEPLKIAKENNEALGGKVKEFKRTAYLNDWNLEGNVVVMANLPYVDETWDFLSPEISTEPRNALFVEKLPNELPDGVKIRDLSRHTPWPLMEIEVLFAGLFKIRDKCKNLIVIIEADECQKQEVILLAERYGFKLKMDASKYITMFD